MESNAKKPLVSVVMATFNEPKDIIAKSLESIVSQDYPFLEIIVSDDSTDEDTINVIDTYAQNDKRICVIRSKERMGFVTSLNAALQQTKGELIARMDGDDISLPDRISKQVSYALTHRDIDIFGGSMDVIDEHDNIISERLYPVDRGHIFRMFLYRSPFAHPTIMFRRSIIDKGVLYNPEFKRAEDIDFYLHAVQKGFNFGNLPDKLLKYRVVGNLGKKRSKEHWTYNHKARKRFIWRMPFFSILSYLISLVYMYIPNMIASRYYKNENSKLQHTS